MRGREPNTVPFSTEAMRANLLRLENEWETVQASRDRDAIYQYLNSLFELVSWWSEEDRAVTLLVGRCTCEGTTRQENRNRLLP